MRRQFHQNLTRSVLDVGSYGVDEVRISVHNAAGNGPQCTATVPVFQ